MTTTTASPLKTVNYSVMYIGTFDGKRHFAVFALLENAKYGQVPNSVRTDYRQCNEIARDYATPKGVRWYGYNG